MRIVFGITHGLICVLATQQGVMTLPAFLVLVQSAFHAHSRSSLVFCPHYLRAAL